MALVLKDVIGIATKRLEMAGCGTPKLDAEVLLSHYLQVDRSFIFAHYSDDLDDKRCEAYFEIIDIRAAGVPVPYITGTQEFMGISFKVNQNVLIPRPDTETLVEETIRIASEKKRFLGGNIDILDLCCGSGAICVSLAYYLPKARLEGTDISKKALETARRNAADYGLAGRIKFVQGDLFGPVKTGAFGKGRFDMIVSNPPYIKSEEVRRLQREIVEFEPLIALDGGTDGLDFYRRIVSEAPRHLKKEGLLMLEIGFDQADDLRRIIEDDGRYAAPEIMKDLAGLDRVVKVRLAAAERKPAKKTKKAKESKAKEGKPEAIEGEAIEKK